MKLSNKHNLPRTFVDVINSLVYDPRESDPNRISITTLINNPRVRLLTLRHWDEIEEDVSNHIWRVLGNSCHYVVSQLDNKKTEGTDTNKSNRLIEEKIEEKVNGITVVGKLDLYDETNKRVEDYKVTSVWSVQMGDHEDWETQLNCYVWLLRKAGFEVTQAQINAILRDWRKGETRKYNDYPKIPFVSVPIKLWSFEDQQKYVEHRVNIYKETRDLETAKIPICQPEERWQKESVYAVYKNNNKTASKLESSEQKAIDWIQNNQVAKAQYRIEKREGIDLKCTEYCSVNKFCSYYKTKYGDNK